MTDKEMHPLTVSQCISSDWRRGYNKAVEEANEVIRSKQAEIEHFRDLTKKIKTEAIKEVTAELYNSFAQYETYDRHHTFEILDKIQSVEDFLFDNLVKEMTEEK